MNRLLELAATVWIMAVRHQALRNGPHVSEKRQLAESAWLWLLTRQSPVAITVGVDTEALTRCHLGLYPSMGGSAVLQLVAQAPRGDAPAH